MALTRRSVVGLVSFIAFLSVLSFTFVHGALFRSVFSSPSFVRLDTSSLRNATSLVLSSLSSHNSKSHTNSTTAKPIGSSYTRVLVVPQTSKESTTWIDDAQLDVEVALYTVDNSSAALHPPLNKGHEVMVYLTYIIDHYHDLPEIIIFTHAHRHAWHNTDLLGFDAVEMVKRLSSDRVARLGYMNIRCGWDPGCPEWLHPYDETELLGKQEQRVLAKVWSELFPLDPLPTNLAQPCCAQFAVSRARVLSIPHARFVFYRDWLLRTPLTDYYSGRIWEFVWQYAFTGQAVVCPPEHACYCDGYGVCFGGEIEYKEFFELRQTKKDYSSELDRLLKEQGLEVEGKDNATLRKVDPGRVMFLKDRIGALDKELDERKSDALERGRDQQHRAKEAAYG
ncbi:hypothetical protein MMC30_008587 [Trapelia coarctata]|nr:hypothetical protein [Trapelia coarctata]